MKNNSLSSNLAWDPGSFRDPEGSVFFYEGKVFRSFPEEAFERITDILKAKFFKELVNQGKIVKTTLENNPSKDLKNKHVLKHEKIPFITYPYEWSFFMLKDAALLTLDILEGALKEGFILKDGTAWNISFYKGRMCFFDVLSIDRYEEGQTWEGYSQFCQEFLYPLLIKASKGLDHQNFFKGSLSGVDVEVANALFGIRDIFRPGVFKHVFLNAKLTGNKKVSKKKVRGNVKVPLYGLLGIVQNLKSVIKALKPNNDGSVWDTYISENTYEDQDEHDKKDFVSKALEKFESSGSVIDFGCNTGEYSILAAQKAKVISCDIDPACIDQLYKKVALGDLNITPVVLNLMNPSSECGWGLRERKSIYDRLQGGAFLSLALIHHICIASNVPLEYFIKFLKSVASQGVIEWVYKEDPMVQFLLRNRKDVFGEYTWENFEKIVSRYFKIETTKKINKGTRELCLLLPLTS